MEKELTESPRHRTGSRESARAEPGDTCPHGDWGPASFQEASKINAWNPPQRPHQHQTFIGHLLEVTSLGSLGSSFLLRVCEPDGEQHGTRAAWVPTSGSTDGLQTQSSGGRGMSVALPLTSCVILRTLSKSLYPSPLFCHMVIMVPIGYLRGLNEVACPSDSFKQASF